MEEERETIKGRERERDAWIMLLVIAMNYTRSIPLMIKPKRNDLKRERVTSFSGGSDAS